MSHMSMQAIRCWRHGRGLFGITKVGRSTRGGLPPRSIACFGDDFSCSAGRHAVGSLWRFAEAVLRGRVDIERSLKIRSPAPVPHAPGTLLIDFQRIAPQIVAIQLDQVESV